MKIILKLSFADLATFDTFFDIQLLHSILDLVGVRCRTFG